MTRDFWHFPRVELAETVYKALAFGPTNAMSMFGPRRSGKTQFLIRDLAPLAEKRGHKAVFVDFWGQKHASPTVLLHALDQTLRGGTFVERLKNAVEGMAPKVRLMSPDKSFEIEVTAENMKENLPTDLLFLMDYYCGQLANEERPTFLLLDEFQEICRAPFAEDIIAALRSSLNKRGGSFAVVFSGSSQDDLKKMFTDRTAPFFAFANDFHLPQLDEEFVDHQINKFNELAKKNIERKDVLSIFNRYRKNPMILNRWLGHMVLNPDSDKEDAIYNTLESVAEQYGFGSTWMDLQSEERIAARLLAESLPIHNDHGEKNSGELTGRQGISGDVLDAAVEELRTFGIAEKSNGDWIIGDDLFRDWICNRPKFEF